MLNLKPHSDDEFETTRLAIANKHRLDSHGKGARALLEDRVYLLARHLLKHDLFGEFVEPRLRRLSSRGRSKKRNQFSELLRVIFDGVGNGIDRQTRSKTGLRLAYAHWHFVPPAFLNAFLKDLGPDLKLGAARPGYEEWVRSHLRKKRNSEAALRYPKALRPKPLKSLKRLD